MSKKKDLLVQIFVMTQPISVKSNQNPCQNCPLNVFFSKNLMRKTTKSFDKIAITNILIEYIPNVKLNSYI